MEKQVNIRINASLERMQYLELNAEHTKEFSNSVYPYIDQLHILAAIKEYLKNIGTEDEAVKELETYIKEYLHTLTYDNMSESFYRVRKKLALTLEKHQIDFEKVSGVLGVIEEQISLVLTDIYVHSSHKLQQKLLLTSKVLKFDYHLIHKFIEEQKNLKFVKKINQPIETISEQTPVTNIKQQQITAQYEIGKIKSLSSDLAALYESLTGKQLDSLHNIEGIASESGQQADSINEKRSDYEDIQDFIKKATGYLHDVISDGKHVHKIIDSIHYYSEQITMLAINSSIENTRETDDADAVVIAKEIREHSEANNKEIELLMKRMTNMDKDMKKVVKQINKVDESIAKSSYTEDIAKQAFESIVQDCYQTKKLLNSQQDINKDLEKVVSKLYTLISESQKTGEEHHLDTKQLMDTFHEAAKQVIDIREEGAVMLPSIRASHKNALLKYDAMLLKWLVLNLPLSDNVYDDYAHVVYNRFYEWYTHFFRYHQNGNEAELEAVYEKFLTIYRWCENAKRDYRRNKESFIVADFENFNSIMDEYMNLLEKLQKEVGE